MVRIKGICFILFCSSYLFSFGQENNRYMVFFSDKTGSPFSLSEPIDFLSDRALDRRERLGIALSEQDLPVSSTYLNELRAMGAEIYFQSKWMNAALIQNQSTLISQIEMLDFVDSAVLVAGGSRLMMEEIPFTYPTTFQPPVDVLSNTNAQLRLMDADDMLADGFTGEGVIIAVFDSGFPEVDTYQPFQHLFENNRILGFKDFVRKSGNVFINENQDSFHGTSVLSCMGASYGDENTGTAPDASYLLCITEDGRSEFRIEEYNWLLAAEYADSAGADIINSSLGYRTFDSTYMNYRYEELNGETTVVARAADIATSKGILVVTSAGNSGNRSYKYVSSPADGKHVLTVGAVDAQGSYWQSSSVGPTSDGRIKPEVAAMGVFTTVFYPNGKYAAGSGTSFAAPLVSGFAAGLLQAHPDWGPKQLKDAIVFTANQADEPDVFLGWGIPNYHRAMNAGSLLAATILKENITVYPNPFSDGTLKIDFGGVQIEKKIEISLLDIQGIEVFRQLVKPTNVPEVMEINVNLEDDGVYFLMFRSRDFSKTVKLIKIK